MMLIPKWGNYPGDGGGEITLVIDTGELIEPGSSGRDFEMSLFLSHR